MPTNPRNVVLNTDGYSERRQEIGPIMFPMHIEKDRHHRFYSATQSKLEGWATLSRTEGKTCIIDGDVFYSPNARRQLTRVPAPDHELSQLDTRYDYIDAIREPRWWSIEFAHLAFLEINPMQTGAFGWALHTPEYHCRKLDKTFSMRTIDIIRWHRLERDLKLMIDAMDVLGNVPPTSNVIDRAFTCGGSYTSNELLKQSIIRCREWFAHWTCRLAYAIAACESIKCNGDRNRRATVEHEWLQTMVQQDWYEGFIASVNATCGAFDGSVEQVGVLLDVVDPRRHQFSVEWLVEYGVPVWYRWGQREIDAAGTNVELKRLAPRTDILQIRTTFLTTTPRSEQIDPKAELNAFMKERTKRMKEIEDKENEESRKRRLQRDASGGFQRLKVFVWEKDDRGIYKRQPVSRAEKEDTLNFYGREQKHFSSVFGEWDCCSAFGDKGEDECEEEDMMNDLVFGRGNGDERERENYERFEDDMYDLDFGYAPDTHDDGHLARQRGFTEDDNMTAEEETSAEAGSSRAHRPKGYSSIHGPNQLLNDEDLCVTEVELYEAINIMHEFMGYVAPLASISLSGPLQKLDHAAKVTYSNLLGKEEVDNDFFESHVLKPALMFLDNLCSTDCKDLPEMWDLFKNCRYPLAGARRTRHVKTMQQADSTIFMVDMGGLATVEWSLGVTTAATALMICRWESDMTDYELCRQLLQRGVEFKVLIRLDGETHNLPHHVRHPHIPARTPGYTFTKADYIAYCNDRRAMLSDKDLAKKALKAGGIVWRLSVECSFENVLSGAWRYSHGASVYTTQDGVRYFDENITEQEAEAICGAYRCVQGMYISINFYESY